VVPPSDGSPREAPRFTHETARGLAARIAPSRRRAQRALVLLRLIALFSHLIWKGEVSTAMMTFADVRPSVWMVFAPALGGPGVVNRRRRLSPPASRA
jgi:hypothetical protein